MNSEFKLISSWRLFPDWFRCTPVKEMICCHVPTMNRVLPWDWHHCPHVSTVQYTHNGGESESERVSVSVIDGNNSAIPRIILLLHCCYCCMFGHAYSWPVAGWSLRGFRVSKYQIRFVPDQAVGHAVRRPPLSVSVRDRGGTYSGGVRTRSKLMWHPTLCLVVRSIWNVQMKMCFTVTACVARCSLLAVSHNLLHFTVA